MKNEREEILIVEIQQQALDRYHLYKSLEYRDLIQIEKPTPKIRIILFCESMDERFRPLLKTHRIELIEMERNEFIKRAVRETPEIVSLYLSKGDLNEVPATKEKGDIRVEFKPLDWGPRMNPSEVLAHLYKEFGRLGVGVEDIPCQYYHRIYWDLCSQLDEDLERGLGKLWLPKAWNYERLLVAEKDYRGDVQKRLNKPHISLILHRKEILASSGGPRTSMRAIRNATGITGPATTPLAGIARTMKSFSFGSAI